MKGKSIIIALMSIYLLLGLVAFSSIPNRNNGRGLTNRINFSEMLSFDAKDGRVDTNDTKKNLSNKNPMLIGTAEFDGDISPQKRDKNNNNPLAPVVPDQPIQKRNDQTKQPNTVVPNSAGQNETNRNITIKQNPNPNAAPARDTNGTQTGETLSNYASEVVKLVNKERTAQGLNTLSIDPAVMNAAQVRAQEQATNFSHTRPNGQSAFSALNEANASYRGAGENIAMGQGTPAQVMEGWMSSPGHRENILRPGFTKIGVGCFKDGSGTYYWAQLFTQ